jgi:hypothetical protein
MSVEGGPDIVTNGLVLYLDAANDRSIVSGSTTWFDLSRNGNTGSLINGPTYNTGSSGNIIFDNTNDQCNITASSGISTNTFTYEIWCRPTSTNSTVTEASTGIGAGLATSQRNVIAPANYGTNSGAGMSVGTNSVVVIEHGNSLLAPILVYTASIPSTRFSHVVAVYNNKQPTLYFNGSFARTGLLSPRTTVYGDYTRVGYGDYGYFSGGIAAVRVYNRALSPREIRQNYHATKGRYGL